MEESGWVAEWEYNCHSPPLSLSCDRRACHPVHPGRYNHCYRIFHRAPSILLLDSGCHQNMQRGMKGGTGRVFKYLNIKYLNIQILKYLNTAI